MKNITLILFCLHLTLTLFAQSPWTQGKGEGFGQLSLMAIPTYDTYFDKNSDESGQFYRQLSETALQAYLEYGVLDGTTLIFDTQFKYLTSGDLLDSLSTTEAGNLSGLGNLRLQVRQRIYDNGVAIAAQLGVEAPTGRYDDLTGLRTGYDAWTFNPSLSIGGGLGKGYIYAYGGVGFRTNEYSNYLNLGLEGGYRPFEPFWVMLFFDVLHSFENGNRIETINNAQTAFYVNDQEWASLGLKLLYNINDNIGLTAASTISAFAANQVPQSPSIAIGIFTEW